MLFALDLSTLLTVLCVLLVLMTLVFGAMWLGKRSDAVAGTLALGFLSMTSGALLASQFQSLPQWSWAIGGCALILTGEALIWASLRAFDKQRTPVLAVLAVPGLYVALCLATGLWVHQPSRAALFAGMLALLCFAGAYQLYVGGRKEPLAARRPLIVLFALLGTVYAARGAVALAGLGSYGVVALVALFQVFNVFAYALGLFALIKGRAETALRHAAHTDQLTGIANRRSFFELSAKPLRGAVLLVDLDHFKRINDRYGHAAGDQVLVRFAALVSQRLPRGAVFARLGGEEFGLYLPGGDEAGATSFAERLRRAVMRLDLEAEDVPAPVTVSIGVATTREGRESLETLLGRADGALYRAKELGRNRVHSDIAEWETEPAAPAVAKAARAA